MTQQAAGAPAFSGLDGWGLARRRVVRALALVPTAVGGSFALGACSAGDAPGPDGHPLRALSAAQARTLEAVADAVVPTTGGFPSAREAEVMRRFDEELSFVSPSIRDDLKAALGVLEYLPPLYGHFGRFSYLDRAARQALLQQMCGSRVELIRTIGSNVKILVQFFYFAHPKTWAATGYDGPFGRLPERMDDQRRWYAEHTGVSA